MYSDLVSYTYIGANEGEKDFVVYIGVHSVKRTPTHNIVSSRRQFFKVSIAFLSFLPDFVNDVHVFLTVARRGTKEQQSVFVCEVEVEKGNGRVTRNTCAYVCFTFNSHKLSEISHEIVYGTYPNGCRWRHDFYFFVLSSSVIFCNLRHTRVSQFSSISK